MKAWGFLLAILLQAPFASATSTEGTFIVEGAVVVPEATHAEGGPLALYVPETAGISHLRVHIPRATVFEYRTTFCGVQTGVVPPLFVECGHSEQSWPVADAVMTLRPGEHAGILGVYAAPEATLGTDASGDVSWESRAVSNVGNPESATTYQQSAAFYHQRVTGRHLEGVGNASLVYQGGGALKLRGPDVEIASSNLTRHETGKAKAGTTEEIVTVLFVRFDAPATVTLGDVPFQAALSSVEAAWDGPLRFTPREGSLRADDRIYFPTGTDAELEGRFTARLAPLEGGKARLELAGDLRATSMAAYAPANAGLAEGGRPWLALLIVGAVVVGAAGGAAVWSRLHRRAPAAWHAEGSAAAIPFTVEDCLEAGALACGEENWTKGAEWFERGLRLAPTSARLHADLAFCLSQLGEIDRAMEHFRKSHALSTHGESAFNAACTAAFFGREDEAAGWLVAALERSPEFVVHLRDDHELSPLLERPEVALAERRARERMRAQGWRPSGSDAEP